LIFFAALISFTSNDFSTSKPTLFHVFLTELVAPTQQAAAYSKKSISDFVSDYLNIVDTRRENDFLRDKVSEMNMEIFRLNSLVKENERLKALLAFGETVTHIKVLGQVIGWDQGGQYKILRIDKGYNDGLVSRAAVITADGLVGYTYKVYKNYTDILTILDVNNRVDVLADRTRTHGIVEGVSEMNCRMKYVPRTEKLLVEDLLVTAGIGLLYPKGIRVGKIKNINEASVGLTQDILVTPAVDFTKLEEVVVLLNAPSSPSAMNEQSEN
jgi:rod shape-determining protein MreC